MTGADEVTVVVPVKPWRLAKSRLDVGEGARFALARAFALDVLTAVSRSSQLGRLVVVTAEIELAVAARRLGAAVLDDRPMLSTDGLNDALGSGRRWAIARRPRLPIVVVPADLPALTTAVFDQTVELLRPYDSAFVPDAMGRGTTLAWARRPEALRTHYGVGSAMKHSAAGSHAVFDADMRARRDVDTGTDLVEARYLGVGDHTATVLDELTRSGVRAS